MKARKTLVVWESKECSNQKTKKKKQKKKKKWAVKNIFLLDFAKYLSHSEAQKNSKIVDV